MKLTKITDKQEALFQGFYLLLSSTTAKQIEQITPLILLQLADPDTTKQQVETACARAMEALCNEKILEATYNKNQKTTKEVEK